MLPYYLTDQLLPLGGFLAAVLFTAGFFSSATGSTLGVGTSSISAEI
jgi:hypothetical protein